MPQKIYAFADATNPFFVANGSFLITQPFPAPELSVPLSTYVTNPSIGRWEFLISEINKTSGVLGTSSNINGLANSVFCQFQLNYALAIPASALIRKVTYRLPRSVNLLYGVDFAGLGAMAFQVVHTGFTLFTNNITYGGAGSFYPGLSFQLLESYAGSLADIVLFDYGGVDANRLTRTQLISNFAIISNTAQNFSIRSTSSASPGNVAPVDLVGNLSVGNGWTVTVEYDEAFTWTLASPPADRTVQPGDHIEFVSGTLDFTQITDLNLVLRDEAGVIVGTVDVPPILWVDTQPNHWEFILPPFGDGLDVQQITYEITSTQFTGSLPLQTVYPIYFYNAPGVYTFVQGRRHDTFYVRTTPISTVDTKIPDPTGKTGYY